MCVAGLSGCYCCGGGGGLRCWVLLDCGSGGSVLDDMGLYWDTFVAACDL